MADQPNSFQVTTDATGATKLQVMSSTVHIKGSDQKDIPLGSIDLKTQCPTGCTIVVDATPLPSVHSPFDVWVLVALAVPLLLATIFGFGVVGYMLWGGRDPKNPNQQTNIGKTVDKLAQLLSEGDTKMSLSRVQALIFTYVIAFGSLLIIARTGNFPTEIPTNLAILSGGSLATYLISKGIQTSANPPANKPPPAG